MKRISTIGLTLTGVLLCYGCALESGQSETDVTPDEDVAASSAALSSCAWGDGAYVKTGRAGPQVFPFSNTLPVGVLSPLGGTIGIFSSINTSNVSTSNTKFRFTTGTTSGLGAASWGGSGYTWGGDFNGDGIGDIASASGGTMYFKLGNGQSFTGGARTVFNQWGGSGFTFAADFNADGRTDIASANGGSVYMRMNVQAPGADLIPAVEESTWFVANQWGGSGFTFAADFNGDGFADLASASGSTIYMKLNVGNAFQSYPLTGIGSWGGSGYTFTGDFNNDGRADIVSFNGSSAYMKLGTSNGSFSVQTWNIGGAGAGSWGGSGYTWVEDFNGDGLLDVASADGGVVHVKLNQVGSFANQEWSVTNAWGGAAFTKVGRFRNGGPSIFTASGCTIYHHVPDPANMRFITTVS